MNEIVKKNRKDTRRSPHICQKTHKKMEKPCYIKIQINIGEEGWKLSGDVVTEIRSVWIGGKYKWTSQIVTGLKGG